MLFDNGEEVLFDNGEEALAEKSETLFEESPYFFNNEYVFDNNQEYLFDNGEVYLFDTSLSEILYSSIDTNYGRDVINYITTKVYPRKVDSSTVVLYTSDYIRKIDAGETVSVIARYTDPNQEAQNVAGKDFITPVATTDYTANAQEDGGGADLTANLGVTVTFSRTSAEIELENTGGADLYVTFFQLRGKGIYAYSPVEVTASDSTSIATYDKHDMENTLRYIDDVDLGQEISNSMLEKLKNPKNFVDEVTFAISTSWRNLMAFMYLEVGDKILVPPISYDTIFYIQKISMRGSVGDMQVTYKLIHEDLSEV